MTVERRLNCETGEITEIPFTPVPRGVPQAVTPLQIRKALRAVGRATAMKNFIDAQTEDLREAWEYADEIKRLDPIVAAAAAQFGFTQAQVDALFRDAAAL